MEKRNKCPAFHQIKISHAAYCRLKAKMVEYLINGKDCKMSDIASSIILEEQ